MYTIHRKKMSRTVGGEDFDDSLFEGLSKEEIEELDGIIDPDVGVLCPYMVHNPQSRVY